MKLLDRFEDCCNYFLAILDGKYGWFEEALALLVIVVVFNIFVKALLRRLHQRFSRQHKLWQDSFVRALYKPLSYYIWVVAVINAINIVNERITGESFFESLHMLLAMGGILALAWFFLRWKNNAVEFMITKSRKHEISMDPGKVDVIGKVVTIVILFVTVLLLLETSHRSMNTLIAFGGIGGLAIAIASQEIIGNFFGGFMIYLTHPFGIGDWIVLTDRNIEGHVEEIGWYMTRIRTFDKRPIYVPNSIFSKIVVMNPSRMSHRQFKEIIGIRSSDIHLLRPIVADIKAMLLEHPDIDHFQRIIVNFTNFGNNSLDILVDAYTMTTESVEYAAVREDLLLKIADILVKHGTEMPIPTTIVVIPEGLRLMEFDPRKLFGKESKKES